ncbi:hypothetical protein [Rossellomorea sp. RS05]|uniref:hypothetical protein n=1 Tax=Rossellomorea sp. RS05 TaxID=3149166 RepID=UPI003221A16D
MGTESPSIIHECLAAEAGRLLRKWRADDTLQAQPKRLIARPAESDPPQRKGTVFILP